MSKSHILSEITTFSESRAFQRYATRPKSPHFNLKAWWKYNSDIPIHSKILFREHFHLVHGFPSPESSPLNPCYFSLLCDPSTGCECSTDGVVLRGWRAAALHVRRHLVRDQTSAQICQDRHGFGR